MAKSTKSLSFQKVKPYPEFPLTAHPSGRWCKKFQGKQYYFGPVKDWQSALDRYKREWPYILDGTGQPSPDELATDNDYAPGDLCNEFLNAKGSRLESGEITARTFRDAHITCGQLVEYLGKDRCVEKLRPVDFEKLRTKLAKRFSTPNLKNIINRYRGVFRFAKHRRKIEVDFGDAFNPPTAKSIRKAQNQTRQDSGPQMFEAAEICTILDECDPVLRPMVLLGINCGFGNTDVANLPKSAVDLDAGWVEFPREKTGINRRVPLWPETVAAVREAIKVRPAPKSYEDDGLLFLTHHGAKWVRVTQNAKGHFVPIDSLSQKFTKLLKNLKINGRKNLRFYSLRHNFQTISGDARDPDATTAIMGHVDSSMGSFYRERIDDDRLIAVTNVVRDWLWPDGNSEPAK